MTPIEKMQHVDALFSHVWMVRTFVKHSEEAIDDEELSAIHRTLYDVMLAVGKPFQENDAATYFRQLQKKFSKLRSAADTFAEIQPEVSSHTNFQMAAQSLSLAVRQIDAALQLPTNE